MKIKQSAKNVKRFTFESPDESTDVDQPANPWPALALAIIGCALLVSAKAFGFI